MVIPKPKVVRVVLLATVCWVAASGPLAAQTWEDLLGALHPTPTAQPEVQVQAQAPTVEPTPAPPVDAVDASFALREALLVAAEGAVVQASRVDGFASNPDIRVPLPGRLESSRETLTRFGLRQEVDDLDLALNRAAEATAAEALPDLTSAVRDLPLDDPLATLQAGGHAATDRLRAGSEAALAERLKSFAATKMAPAGVTAAYERLVQKGGNLVAQAGIASSDLSDHVAARTVSGLLTLVAAGETAIRTDPAARTTPLLARVFASSAGAPPPTPAPGQPVSSQGGETQQALKQALILGARRAVERASQVDGYYRNPLIRIPLPKAAAQLGDALRGIGMGKIVDELELSLNRAAEKAAVEATPILVDAVTSVNLGDVVAILRGGDTAATDLLRTKTEVGLTAVFRPVITTKMDEAGVTRNYKRLVEQGGPFLALFGEGGEPDLPAYVTGKALDGLFALIAEEEAKIRKDPAARTTDLLRRIFG